LIVVVNDDMVLDNERNVTVQSGDEVTLLMLVGGG
jgi:sulfur carrier protein ThiS